MTDEELGYELCPDDPALGAQLAARMAPEKRAGYERLIAVGRELTLWEAGLGPKPEGVIATRPGRMRR